MATKNLTWLMPTDLTLRRLLRVLPVVAFRAEMWFISMVAVLSRSPLRQLLLLLTTAFSRQPEASRLPMASSLQVSHMPLQQELLRRECPLSSLLQAG